MLNRLTYLCAGECVDSRTTLVSQTRPLRQGHEGLMREQRNVTIPGRQIPPSPGNLLNVFRLKRLPAKKFANSWLIARDVLEQFATGYDRRPGNKATLFNIKDTATKQRAK